MIVRNGKKRAFANQERQAQAQRMSRLGRSMLMLLATVISFGTLSLLVVDQLYRPDTFIIDQLKIKGSFRQLQPQQIESAVNQQAVGNFFSVDLSDIKQRVEKLPWVQTAEVRRDWPNSLIINVREQQPVMRWQNDRWINAQGQVIDLPDKVELSNPIRLSGSEQDSRQILQQAYKWKQQLLESGLELVGLALSQRHAYSVQVRYPPTNSEFRLLLGRHQIEQRLARFLSLFNHQFMQSNQRLLNVDARYPDGLAIKTAATDFSASEVATLVLNKTTRFPNR